jgi:hypothetical protein
VAVVRQRLLPVASAIAVGGAGGQWAVVTVSLQGWEFNSSFVCDNISWLERAGHLVSLQCVLYYGEEDQCLNCFT